MTFGKFTKNGPTQEQLRDTTTKLTFFAQGSSIDNPKKRMNLKAVFVGPDPGYTLTSITVSQAALCLLKVRPPPSQTDLFFQNILHTS